MNAPSIIANALTVFSKNVSIIRNIFCQNGNWKRNWN